MRRSSADAEIAEMMGRYRGIVQEMMNSKRLRCDIRIVVETLHDHSAELSTDDFLRSIAMTAFVRGVITGIEMERTVLPE